MKLISTFLLGGLLLCQLAQSQQRHSSPVPFANTITAAALRHHLGILAGAEMEGRETATEGQRKAAAYIAQYFRQIKLQPGNHGSYQQVFDLQQDTLQQAVIHVGEKSFVFGRDFICSVKDNQPSHLIFDEVVFAGYGIREGGWDDYKGLDVKNKVVVLMGGEPKENDSVYVVSRTALASAWSEVKKKASLAAALGARSILVILPEYKSPSDQQMRYFAKGRMYLKSSSEDAPVNTYRIAPALARALLGEQQYGSLMAAYGQRAGLPSFVVQKKGRIDFEKATLALQSSNVLGYLEGTDKKKELVVISAHYDHLGQHKGQIYFGADDDGSGTVSVLEIAEAFAKAKKAGKGPRRSLVFMTVSGEEKGLLGSSYYTDHPVYPLANTVADLNIDMVGRIGFGYQKDKDSANYVYLIGDNKLSSALRPLSEFANAQYTHLKLDYKYNDPNDPEKIYYRSDHYNFAKNKIPIIFYFDGVHQDYHQPTDTPDKINYALLTRRAQLVFYTAWAIANREDRLPVDRNEK